MAYDKICKNCNKEMKEIKKEVIAETTYHYLKCDKCKSEVARRED